MPTGVELKIGVLTALIGAPFFLVLAGQDAEADAMTLLRAEKITVLFDGRAALRDVSFAVAAGEVVGLIGPNGAGKTTLLRTCARLLTPQDGRVLLEDQALADIPRRDLARVLAFIASGAPCHWPMEVERLVALGRMPRLSPWSPPAEADAAAIRRALELTDATPFRGRATTELSDGERARVMLARALAGEPRLLLADEPVSGLDPQHQLSVMRVLAGLATAGGAVVVTLHDLGLAARFCDRLVALDRGEIVADGLPAEVLSERLLAEVFGIQAVHGERAGEPYLVPWAALDGKGPDHG